MQHFSLLDLRNAKLSEPDMLGRAYEYLIEKFADDAGKKELATLLEESVEPETAIIDWARKDDVHREMRKKLKRQLRASGYASEQLDAIAAQLVDLLKVRKGR